MRRCPEKPLTVKSHRGAVVRATQRAQVQGFTLPSALSKFLSDQSLGFPSIKWE